MENTLEVKDNTILNMKKTHKNLQERYIKLCLNIKKQESDNYLYQAKLLKKRKLTRDSKKLQYSYILNNNNKLQLTECTNTNSDFEYPNLKTNSHINAKKENNSNSNEIILPVISTNNSVKIEDYYNSDNDNILATNKRNKLDEINEMMKKVIDDN